jgi:GTP pyrophosphokinase
MKLSIEKLAKKVKEYCNEDISKIYKAYEFADNKHKGQVRKSGEPYIIHPLHVGYILTELHADIDTICAGLLHDTIEDTNTTKEDLLTTFNMDIANMVDGVTKITNSNGPIENLKIVNTRKIIISTTKDARVLIIKLADRLHNMRTLEFMKPSKQIEKAKETMDLFVPLAYYIGATNIKRELEKLSKKYLSLEDEYQETKDECIDKLKYTINECINDTDDQIVSAIKNIYGIYKKMDLVEIMYDIKE